MDDDTIELRVWCPACRASRWLPVSYGMFDAWMDHTPIEELTEDEQLIEALTTGRCDQHSERSSS